MNRAASGSGFRIWFAATSSDFGCCVAASGFNRYVEPKTLELSVLLQGT